MGTGALLRWQSVGMVLPHQLPVATLDEGDVGIGFDSQNSVMISGHEI
jgi:hypothetical protein